MTTRNQNKTHLLAGWIALILLAITPKASTAMVTGSYMYNLSNFYGVVGYEWCHPYFDLKTGEIYVAQGGSVQVFNTAGMQIYSFSDGELGVIQDVSTDSEGNILALSWINQGYSIVKCNFRGEPRREIQIANLPEEFAGFSPNRMVFREGLFYLVDKIRLRVAVIDRDGAYLKGY